MRLPANLPNQLLCNLNVSKPLRARQVETLAFFNLVLRASLVRIDSPAGLSRPVLPLGRSVAPVTLCRKQIPRSHMLYFISATI